METSYVHRNVSLIVSRSGDVTTFTVNRAAALSYQEVIRVNRELSSLPHALGAQLELIESLKENEPDVWAIKAYGATLASDGGDDTASLTWTLRHGRDVRGNPVCKKCGLQKYLHGWVTNGCYTFETEAVE